MFHLRGEEIIWTGENYNAFRKRGSMVIKSIERDKSSIGFVGSDRAIEDGYKGYRETLEPVVNEKGQFLRFGLIACNAMRARSKLRNNEQLRVATSYPLIASMMLGNTSTEFVLGGVEAELVDRCSEFDVGFELIQSGNSIRENGVTIIEDNILGVTLEMLTTPYE